VPHRGAEPMVAEHEGEFASDQAYKISRLRSEGEEPVLACI
jgi:hypothetical protein